MYIEHIGKQHQLYNFIQRLVMRISRKMQSNKGSVCSFFIFNYNFKERLKLCEILQFIKKFSVVPCSVTYLNVFSRREMTPTEPSAVALL